MTLFQNDPNGIALVVALLLSIEGGRPVLIFIIGNNLYYSDVSAIHEIVRYPAKRYKLEESVAEDNYLLIHDIGKELYAFTVTKV